MNCPLCRAPLDIAATFELTEEEAQALPQSLQGLRQRNLSDSAQDGFVLMLQQHAADAARQSQQLRQQLLLLPDSTAAARSAGRLQEQVEYQIRASNARAAIRLHGVSAQTTSHFMSMLGPGRECVCSNAGDPTACAARCHNCICESYGPSGCGAANSHTCICAEVETDPETCRSYTHDHCVCAEKDPASCRKYRHECICAERDPETCLAVGASFHDCICAMSPEICRQDYHDCICIGEEQAPECQAHSESQLAVYALVLAGMNARPSDTNVFGTLFQFSDGMLLMQAKRCIRVYGISEEATEEFMSMLGPGRECVCSNAGDPTACAARCHNCICESYGPSGCGAANSHTCICAEVETDPETCRSYTHDHCVCAEKDPASCRKYRHECICAERDPETCRNAGSHDCICTAVSPEICRQDYHECICTGPQQAPECQAHSDEQRAFDDLMATAAEEDF